MRLDNPHVRRILHRPRFAAQINIVRIHKSRPPLNSPRTSRAACKARGEARPFDMNEIETFIVERLWHSGDIFDQPPEMLAEAARIYQADRQRFSDLSCIKRNGLDYFLQGQRYSCESHPTDSQPLPPPLRKVSVYRDYKKRKISAALRIRVYTRDGFKCLHCGTSEDLTCDHIVAEIKGGATNQENLQTLCMKCNRKKGTK